MAAVRERQPATRTTTWDDYYCKVLGGDFRDSRAELVFGKVVIMPPPGPWHREVQQELYDALSDAVGAAQAVMFESLVRCSDVSGPVPDLVVCREPRRRYRGRALVASDLMLVVEISDSPAEADTGEKMQIYAEAAVPQYWIVNRALKRLEVRDYLNGAYGEPQCFQAGYNIELKFGDGAVIAVAEFLFDD